MRNQLLAQHKIVRPVYLFTLFFLTLSGFAQMPIFKRYYIADIPGLGWLAEFYVTHYIHYLGAAIFLCISGYMITLYLLEYRKHIRITISGYVRVVMLLGIILSGAFLVYRNLSDVYLSSGFIIFLDIIHISLVIILFMVSFYAVIFKKSWVLPLTKEQLTLR
ncbi:MAG: hypothetical protein K9L30_15080 [Desulfobacterales bacterium]|nr:hypothetical protein [Desulfobacterales bacterium]